MLCHLCDAPPIGQCQACWRFYCRNHGDVVCSECREGHADARTLRSSMLRLGSTDAVTVSGTDSPQAPEQIEEMMARLGLVRRTILKRVVPVVQAQTVGDTQITLVSLELYDDCFSATIRLRVLGDHPDRVENSMFGLPEFSISVTDDAGNSYASTPGGGGGGGDEFRWECTFAPGVSGDATILRFVIDELEWRAFPFGPRFGDRKKRELGPWRFDVPL